MQRERRKAETEAPAIHNEPNASALATEASQEDERDVRHEAARHALRGDSSSLLSRQIQLHQIQRARHPRVRSPRAHGPSRARAQG